jgi:GT2 family glycosyltransferase
MDVSVIIVTRNTCALTCAAVRSVFEIADGLAREVIVVDNGSTDQTAEALAREFPKAKYVRSETNLGFARANNRGAAEATGEFLLLLNSDARLQPGTLAQAVSWMRGHSDCAIAGVQLLNPDGSRQNSIANTPTLATELLNKSLLRRLFPRRYPGKEQRFTQPLEVESIIGAFMLIRRSAWDALGGLDERFFFFLEETDFCLQARRRGWKVFHLPHVNAWHEQGQSARQLGPAARVEYWRSRYLFFEKNASREDYSRLRAALKIKLAADWLSSFLAVALTFGQAPRLLSKHRVNATLVKWHWRGRPVEMGLPR